MEKRFDIYYLPVAVRDIEEIIQYIMIDSPSAALEVIDIINKSISNLQYFPKSGIVPKDVNLEKSGYRMLLIGNYIVFYVIRSEIVEIRRILHGKRNYRFLF